MRAPYPIEIPHRHGEEKGIKSGPDGSFNLFQSRQPKVPPAKHCASTSSRSMGCQNQGQHPLLLVLSGTLRGLSSLQPLAPIDHEGGECPSHAVDVDVDVDVNEFSAMFSEVERAACFSCSRRIELPRRLRQCGPTTPETRSRAVDVQLLARKHTARSLRRRPRSRRRPRLSRRMPWAWTWTLTSSRADSFAHLGQHGHSSLQPLASIDHEGGECPSHALDVDVDVDVNEFSHRLICTSCQHAEWREPLASVVQGESSCPAGRLRQCGPTTPETRSRAVDVQLLVRKHTASSPRQRRRSRGRPRPRLRGNRRGAWLASRHREVAGASGKA